jgi:hypothetical protein
MYIILYLNYNYFLKSLFFLKDIDLTIENANFFGSIYDSINFYKRNPPKYMTANKIIDITIKGSFISSMHIVQDEDFVIF